MMAIGGDQKGECAMTGRRMLSVGKSKEFFRCERRRHFLRRL